ncbi:MAG: hypothetical protein GXC78_11330 [Chitinophagaceae bacterium]|nr:hypothetical protein [Chitinophagaceae bacterium]
MTAIDSFENSGLYARPYSKWLQHLEKQNNTRIIFSGRFGSGKTTFLAHYFHLHRPSTPPGARYRAFSISPVHYSISSNEDIIKYIKYDILISFLKQKIDFNHIDVSYVSKAIPFAGKNIKKFIPLLLRMIPKVGKELKDIYTETEKLVEKFIEFSKQDAKEEADVLSEFMGEVESEEGALFGSDLVVSLIQKKLSSLKEESKKENVLIIDDLDRLDPDHVFRILNVFSAHIHSWEAENKFGFDKIIIVCDVENLRNIFKAKFGGQADFNGYIDKFYSTEIFNFENTDLLRDTIGKAIGNIQIDIRSIRWDTYVKEIDGDKRILFDLCDLLVEKRRINLRTIFSRLQESIDIVTNESLNINNSFNIQPSKYPTLFQIMILKRIVGDYDYLIELLHRIPAKHFTINSMNYHGNIFLFMLEYQKTFFKKGRIIVDLNGKKFKLDATKEFDRDIKQLKISILDDSLATQYNYTKEEFKELLIEFIVLLKHSEV